MSMLSVYSFETNARLEKSQYEFTFETREFRLLRGNDLEYHSLYTIIGTLSEEEQVYDTVLRLFDHWSWGWKTGVCCEYQRGFGLPDGTRLKDVKNLNNVSKARNGSVVSPAYVLQLIEETQALALSLRNQALCAGSPFLSFLSYWRILELPYPSGPKEGKPEDRAKQWVDHVPSSRVSIPEEITAVLEENHFTLGHYLWDSCRCAIAHLKSENKRLSPSRTSDRLKISQALKVVARLADEFMWNELKIGQHYDKLSILKSKKRRGAGYRGVGLEKVSVAS